MNTPGWNQQPVAGPPPGPARSPRKRHIVRNSLIVTGGIIVGIIVASALANPSKPAAQVTPPPVTAPAYTTPPVATPAATTPPASPTRVEFVVTGQVPASEFGEVDVTFGSDTSTHDRTFSSLSGTRRWSVPFNGSASYYDVGAVFTGDGHVSCKIVVTGPGDQPLTVAHGSADASGSNGSGDCTAQAAPTDSTGLSWSQE